LCRAWRKRSASFRGYPIIALDSIQNQDASRRELARGDVIRTRLESLTPREREVMDLLVTGKPNKIMAADLGVSQRTVEMPA